MSSDRETTRIVRSWLEEGVTALPDRVLDTVLDQLPATHQRRPAWPSRRFAHMNRLIPIAAAAAAVIAIAIVGYTLLPAGGFGGRASPDPAATPIPMSTTDSIGPGTYVSGPPFPVAITATIPAGWRGHIAGPYYVDFYPESPSGNGLSFVIFNKVAVDPCDIGKGFADVPGETVADLAAALQDVPGITVSSLADTTYKGYAGKQLTITAAEFSSECTLSQDGYAIWEFPLGGNFVLSSGETAELRILDVGGTRLVLVSEDAGLTPAQRAETQAVLESLVIQPGS